MQAHPALKIIIQAHKIQYNNDNDVQLALCLSQIYIMQLLFISQY